MAYATRFNGAAVPTYRENLNQSKAVLPATGLHLHSAGRLLRHDTGIYSTATPQQRKGEEAYPDLRLHRGNLRF